MKLKFLFDKLWQPPIRENRKFVILDLDGCIADDRRRRKLILEETAPNPWTEYHADCEFDPVMNRHILFLGSRFRPIIFTSRPESTRKRTERWLLHSARLRVEKIFMRPDGCRKSSRELKAQFLEDFLASGIRPDDIAFAVDDREDVLAVYESMGILTLSVPKEKE